LLGDDAESVHQYMSGPLRGKDLASIMKDDRWLAKAGPRVLTACTDYQAIFGFKRPLDESHVIFFLQGT